MNIEVPHEVKNQGALAKRTSQILKNGQDVIIQMGSGTRCSGESKHTLALPHAWHLWLHVPMNWLDLFTNALLHEESLNKWTWHGIQYYQTFSYCSSHFLKELPQGLTLFIWVWEGWGYTVLSLFLATGGAAIRKRGGRKYF